jgi:cation transport regulator ChaC
MPNDDLFYFAYGSNLNRLRKESRTGQIREARKARLSGYRLAFNKRANGGGVYANVVRQPGSEVWGVVYRCRPETLDRMDEYEGVLGGHYERSRVEVQVADSEIVQAITYVAGAKFICPEGQPTPEYLNLIIDGARGHGLPEKHIKYIKQIAAGEDSNRDA